MDTQAHSQQKEYSEVVTKRKKVSTAWCSELSKGTGYDNLANTVNPFSAMYSEFANSYQLGGQGSKQDFFILTYPFKCCQINNFLKNEQLISALEEEIKDSSLTLNARSNDMFCFKQSADLNQLPAEQFPAIAFVLYLLSKFVRPVMQDITGLELIDEQYSITVSKYGHGDYLICHDDQLEGRRIAFVYYLTPDDWDVAKDGGALDLFNVDSETKLPVTIVGHRPPTRNSFTFFEVSPITFHQVAEITRKTGPRLSINGWFYGTEPQKRIAQPKAFQPDPNPMAPTDIGEEDFVKWVSPDYLSNGTINQVSRHFVRLGKKSKHADRILSNIFEASSIQLLTDQLNCLTNCEKSRSFKHCGPPNQKWCSVLPVSRDEINSQATQLDKFLFFFMSDAFMVLLSQMTGQGWLDLSGSSGEEPCKTAGCSHFEVRMWSAGDYSMLRDTDEPLNADSVAVHFFVMSDSSKKTLERFEADETMSGDSNPGSVVYVEKGRKDPVVVIEPQHNSMAVVVASPKKPGLVHFTKYMNKVLTENQRYFEFYLVFNKNAIFK